MVLQRENVETANNAHKFYLLFRVASVGPSRPPWCCSVCEDCYDFPSTSHFQFNRGSIDTGAYRGVEVVGMKSLPTEWFDAKTIEWGFQEIDFRTDLCLGFSHTFFLPTHLSWRRVFFSIEGRLRFYLSRLLMFLSSFHSFEVSQLKHQNYQGRFKKAQK